MPDPAPLTAFMYLLNAFEQASRSYAPAQNGYGEKRRKLLAFVEEKLAALDAAEARLADARREALEEAARELGEVSSDFSASWNGEALLAEAEKLQASPTLRFAETAAMLAGLQAAIRRIRTLAAPRPTEEPTP